jgi:hypothetical protein
MEEYSEKIIQIIELNHESYKWKFEKSFDIVIWPKLHLMIHIGYDIKTNDIFDDD